MPYVLYKTSTWLEYFMKFEKWSSLFHFTVPIPNDWYIKANALIVLLNWMIRKDGGLLLVEKGNELKFIAGDSNPITMKNWDFKVGKGDVCLRILKLLLIVSTSL